MSTLVLNFIIISFLLFYASNHKIKNSIYKWLLPLIFIQLLYIKTFIDVTTVPDLEGYRDHYFYTGSKSMADVFSEKVEFGYYFLNRICFSISQDFHFFLFIYNLIFLSFYFYFIKKHSVNLAFSLILFLLLPFNGSLYILRQHMAIAILLLSYPAIINRNLIKFVTTVVVAMTFHLTAIVFLPIYFLYHMKKWHTIVAVSIVFSPFLYLSVKNPYLLLVFMGDNDKYASILDSGDFSSSIIPAFINLLFLIAYIFVIRRKCLQEGYNRLFFYILIISTVILFLGVGLPLMGRLTLYYTVGLILIIPYISIHINDKFLRNMFVAGVLCLYFYLAYFAGSTEGYMDMKLEPIL